MSILRVKRVFNAAIAVVLSFQVSAQNISASNGLNKTSNEIRLGGTLLNATTSIDFGSSNTSSSIRFFKTTSPVSQDYLTILNGGNVGIGISSPAYRLDVSGALGLSGLSSDPSSPTSGNGVLYYNSSTNKLKGYSGGAWKDVLMQGDVNVRNGLFITNNNIGLGGTLDTNTVVNLGSKNLKFLNADTLEFGIKYNGRVNFKNLNAWTEPLIFSGKSGYQSGAGGVLFDFSIVDGAISPWHNIAWFLDSSLQTGTTGYLSVGKNKSSNNVGHLGFTWLGNNSRDNYLSLGFWDGPNKLTVDGYGNTTVAGKLKGNSLTITQLATGGAAPTTTGTTKMVVTDQNGLLSYQDMPFSSSSFVSGNTIYVDKNSPNATDNRTGISKYSVDKPFKTIQAAVNTIGSNEVIWVKGGKYYENVHFIDDGGYSYLNQGLILENSGIIGGQTTLDLQVGWGSNVFVKGIGNSFILNNSGDGTPSLNVRVFHTEGSLTIENVSISNTSGTTAVLGQVNYGTTLRNVTISKTGGMGYAVHGSKLIFRECDISSVDKGLQSTGLVFFNSNVSTEGLNIYFDNTVDFQSYYSRFYSKNDANITGGNWGSLTKIENSNFEAKTYNVNIWYNNTTVMKASLKNNSFFSYSNPSVTVSITGLTGGETTYVTGNTSNGNINIVGGIYSSPLIVKTNNIKTNSVSATGDILYRGADGMITNLSKGISGQALMVKTDGSLGWETPSANGGSGSVTLPSTQIAYGSTSNLVTGNSNLTFDGSTFAINAASLAPVSYASYKLAVNGNALFTRVKVKESSAWPDYVFANNYNLPSLKQIEVFIKQHKHLPEVPSAEEVKKEGLDIGDNQALLLKKIEELTLYAIEQNKKIEALEIKVEELSRK